MRTYRVIAVILVIGLFCSFSFVKPAMARGGGYWKPTKYDRIYNRKTVETTSGTVEDIQKSNQEKRMPDRIDLILKSDKETVAVHLAPLWFMEKQNIAINKGDTIEVTGSRVKYDGKPAVIATEIKLNGQVFKLREQKGRPLWWQR